MALNCAQSGRASGSRMLELTLLLAAGAVIAFIFFTRPAKTRRDKTADAAAEAVRRKLEREGRG